MLALWRLKSFGMFGVKSGTSRKNHWKYEIIVTFFLKVDIEDQYMHLDSTCTSNALSNDTVQNKKSNSIDNGVLRGKIDFFTIFIYIFK